MGQCVRFNDLMHGGNSGNVRVCQDIISKWDLLLNRDFYISAIEIA